MHTIIPKLALIAALSIPCAQAAAGFTFSDPSRTYGIGIDTGTETLQTVEGTGYFADNIALSLDNIFGSTAVKMDLESTLQDNTYKSTTLINLKADSASSPRHDSAGGVTIFINSFIVDEQTTVRISYSVENKGDLGSYFLHLLGPDGTTLINDLITDSRSDSHTLSLSPGAYILLDSTVMQGLQSDQFGEWTISSTMSMMIVPTPATLALFLPATLLATRRRR